MSSKAIRISFTTHANLLSAVDSVRSLVSSVQLKCTCPNNTPLLQKVSIELETMAQFLRDIAIHSNLHRNLKRLKKETSSMIDEEDGVITSSGDNRSGRKSERAKRSGNIAATIEDYSNRESIASRLVTLNSTVDNIINNMQSVSNDIVPTDTVNDSSTLIPSDVCYNTNLECASNCDNNQRSTEETKEDLYKRIGSLSDKLDEILQGSPNN